MKRPIASFIFLAVALVFFLVGRAKHPRPFRPQAFRASLPLTAGTSVLGTFRPDESDIYEISVEVARTAPESVFDETVFNKQLPFDVEWQVTHRGSAVGRGSGALPARSFSSQLFVGRDIGEINADRYEEYSIRAFVKQGIPQLQNCKTELVVAMSSRSLERRIFGNIPVVLSYAASILSLLAALVAFVYVRFRRPLSNSG